MDAFGIGQAIKAVAIIYFQSSRCSGRTTAMLENLRDGDRVLFTNNEEAKRVRHLAKEKGLNITCIASPIEKNPIENGTSQGRSIFDHSWIEDYYLAVLKKADNDIKIFTKALSGWSEAHEETKQKALEIAKLQI